MSRKAEFLEEDDRQELKEEDVKQPLVDVLDEVYSKNKKIVNDNYHNYFWLDNNHRRPDLMTQQNLKVLDTILQ